VWLAAACLYVLCPLDFDFMPMIGWFDDLFVAVMGIRKFRQGMRDRETQESKVIDVQPSRKPPARRVVEQEASLN